MLDDQEGVVFVDNSALFDDAVETWGFWMVFEDEFAGDFGHMTKLGKQLLARNAASGVRRALAQSEESP